MRQVKDLTFILLMLLNVLVVARAQTSATATVSGTVSDAQGAVVAGAVITLVDAATSGPPISCPRASVLPLLASFQPCRNFSPTYFPSARQ